MGNTPYNFYRFDQTGGDDGKEWRNYKQSPFNFEPGVGYLYAQGIEYHTFVGFRLAVVQFLCLMVCVFIFCALPWV